MLDHYEYRMMRRIGVFAVVAWFTFWLTPARAHDVWANNVPVPSWVKDECCGPTEVHDLTKEGISVSEVIGGWKIDGINQTIKNALPSQDGHFWAFYRNYGPDTIVHCLFVPMSF